MTMYTLFLVYIALTNSIVALFQPQEVSLYEASQKLKYLDMVIQESLRFYTPVSRYILCVSPLL